tara:strand:- start:138 stop:515 length:378 start_codon:yes stop_codon:yes gene_type:complete
MSKKVIYLLIFSIGFGISIIKNAINIPKANMNCVSTYLILLMQKMKGIITEIVIDIIGEKKLKARYLLYSFFSGLEILDFDEIILLRSPKNFLTIGGVINNVKTTMKIDKDIVVSLKSENNIKHI